MTEPKPETQYFIDGNWPPKQSESEIQAECVAALRRAGAFVVVTSQDRRTRKQLAGLPDVLVFWRGHTLLLEFKTFLGARRVSQLAFAASISEQLGSHLHYSTCVGMYDLLGALDYWGLDDLADALESDG